MNKSPGIVCCFQAGRYALARRCPPANINGDYIVRRRYSSINCSCSISITSDRLHLTVIIKVHILDVMLQLALEMPILPPRQTQQVSYTIPLATREALYAMDSTTYGLDGDVITQNNKDEDDRPRTKQC